MSTDPLYALLHGRAVDELHPGGVGTVTLQPEAERLLRALADELRQQAEREAEGQTQEILGDLMEAAGGTPCPECGCDPNVHVPGSVG